jgi:hypothetical protein
LLDAPRAQQHINCKSLKQPAEPSARFRPRHGDRLDPVRRTFHPRRARPQDRLKLHRVQVPPRPLRRQIVQRAFPPADRTGSFLSLLPHQAYFHSFFRQFQLHVRHLPRQSNPHQKPIMFLQFVVGYIHALILPRHQHPNPDFPGLCGPAQRSEAKPSPARSGLSPINPQRRSPSPKPPNQSILKAFSPCLQPLLPIKKPEEPFFQPCSACVKQMTCAGHFI